MNALFELVGKTLRGFEYDKLVAMDPELFKDCSIERTPVRLAAFADDPSYDYVKIIPTPDSKPARDFAESVKFAKVWCDEFSWGEETPHCAILRSERDASDEHQFLTDLESICYNNGYGSQELFGIIVFKDGTWLERCEYDGSEWWAKGSTPVEEEWFK